MEDFTKDCELITRQISWLHVYCLELNILEQPGMPKERHEEIMALRDNAPHFFWLASNLLKDALILGLDNILDKSKNGRQLDTRIYPCRLSSCLGLGLPSGFVVG